MDILYAFNYGPIPNHDGPHLTSNTLNMLVFHVPQPLNADTFQKMVTSYSQPAVLSPRNGIHCYHQVEVTY